MSYGTLNTAHRKALRKALRGKIVHDLGAGDLELSRELLTLGASRVYAIDKMEHRGRLGRGLHYKRSYFHDLRGPLDTIFLSWPINHDVGLAPLLRAAKTIVYLGKNTDGMMCGTPDIFATMICRELLDYVPDRKNCLVIVGRPLGTPREPTGEELAGLTMPVNFYYYEDAEAGRPTHTSPEFLNPKTV